MVAWVFAAIGPYIIWCAFLKKGTFRVIWGKAQWRKSASRVSHIMGLLHGIVRPCEELSKKFMLVIFPNFYTLGWSMLGGLIDWAMEFSDVGQLLFWVCPCEVFLVTFTFGSTNRVKQIAFPSVDGPGFSWLSALIKQKVILSWVRINSPVWQDLALDSSVSIIMGANSLPIVICLSSIYFPPVYFFYIYLSLQLVLFLWRTLTNIPGTIISIFYFNFHLLTRWGWHCPDSGAVLLEGSDKAIGFVKRISGRP